MDVRLADYSPVTTQPQKIKKNLHENLVLELEPNPDILKFVSENYSNKIIIGFSAETENIEDFARKNLLQKIWILLLQMMYLEMT